MKQNIQSQLTILRHLNLKLEDAPAFGGGSMPAKDESLFVVLAHFFPLIIWPWKRKVSPAVDAHGKEALNFAITAMLILWPIGILGSLLGVTVAKIVTLA